MALKALKALGLSQDFSVYSPAFANYDGPQVRWIKRMAFDRGGGQKMLTTMHVSTHLDAPRRRVHRGLRADDGQ